MSAVDGDTTRDQVLHWIRSIRGGCTTDGGACKSMPFQGTCTGLRGQAAAPSSIGASLAVEQCCGLLSLMAKASAHFASAQQYNGGGMLSRRGTKVKRPARLRSRRRGARGALMPLAPCSHHASVGPTGSGKVAGRTSRNGCAGGAILHGPAGQVPGRGSAVSVTRKERHERVAYWPWAQLTWPGAWAPPSQQLQPQPALLAAGAPLWCTGDADWRRLASVIESARCTGRRYWPRGLLSTPRAAPGLGRAAAEPYRRVRCTAMESTREKAAALGLRLIRALSRRWARGDIGAVIFAGSLFE